jgi:hypothetical protein
VTGRVPKGGIIVSACFSSICGDFIWVSAGGLGTAAIRVGAVKNKSIALGNNISLNTSIP